MSSEKTIGICTGIPSQDDANPFDTTDAVIAFSRLFLSRMDTIIFLKDDVPTLYKIIESIQSDFGINGYLRESSDLLGEEITAAIFIGYKDKMKETFDELYEYNVPCYVLGTTSNEAREILETMAIDDAKLKKLLMDDKHYPYLASRVYRDIESSKMD